MIGALSDPTDEAFDLTSDRSKIYRLACSAFVALCITFATAILMFAWTPSSGHTTSGPPFSLIHRFHRVHTGLITTTSLALLASLFYPFAVVAKPRPRFLHLAGSYLVLNLFTLCCIVATTWAGCARIDAIRFPTAAISMAGTGLCFALLQVCIKAKVEALQVGSPEESQRDHWAMQLCFRIMFSPLSAIFVVVACLVPMGLVTDWFWADLLLRTTAIVICLFLVVFIAFTCFSVRCMIQCWRLLGLVVDDFVTRHRLRRLVAIHIIATCSANLTSVAYFFSSAGIVFRWFPVETLFASFGLDNLCNMMCALSLSGLWEAMCGRRAVVSTAVSTAGRDTIPDVVKDLEFAGRMARSGAIGASAYDAMAGDDNADDFL